MTFLVLAFIHLPAALWAIIASVSGSGALAGLYRRSPLGQARAAATKTTRQVFREEERTERFLDRLRGRIRGATGKYREYRRTEELAHAPVEALKDSGARNVRWSALREAGIETLADLEKRSSAELEELPGVGRKSAEAIRESFVAATERLRDKPLPPPSATLEEPGAQRLAQPVVRLMGALETLGPSPARLRREADLLREQVTEIQQAAGFWRWLFRSKNDEQIQRTIILAEEAATRAQGVMESGLLEESQSRRQEASRRARGRRSTTEVQEAYEKNYAAACSALDSALGENADTLGSLLGSEIAEALGVEPGMLLDEATLRAIEGTSLYAGGLNVALRRYQEFGAKFLLAQERTVLGDEMGLGKTVQTLAALAQIWSARPSALFVVVAPAGLLCNWTHEIEQKAFFPAFLAHGSTKEPAVQIWLQAGGTLVTSYSTLRSFPLHERVKDAGRTIDFLVADEAHFVKNPDAQRTQALAELVPLTERISFLSGTPMENHPLEFANLVQLLDPPSGFRLSDEELQEPHSGRVSRRFHEEIAGIYLRRNQSDVLLELPEKIEVEEWVALSGLEREEYEAAVAAGNFMAMRQAVTRSVVDENSKRRLAPSTKMQRAADLLAEHEAAGRKVIIFSYFLKVLEELSERFEHVGIISGGVSIGDREVILQRFKKEEGHRILLAQITAAGQGLNLQEASVIMLMEPQLTPGAEAQAIARAHRMGQTQRVMVHRLLAENSVDERLVQILDEKEVLFDMYARQSLAKDRNPEAIETQIAKKIVELEQERLQPGSRAEQAS